MEKIGSGAEAIIYKDGLKVVKDRVSKSYRIPEIDSKLRTFRTKREAKILEKFGYNVTAKDFKLTMDYINGPKLKDVMSIQMADKVGSLVGYLHDKGIVHNDLTTSNMIVDSGKIKLIDFGLSAFSDKAEERAVDLHLLNRALESAHHEIHDECWTKILEGYKNSFKGADEVLTRLNVVSSRGRNKKK